MKVDESLFISSIQAFSRDVSLQSDASKRLWNVSIGYSM